MIEETEVRIRNVVKSKQLQSQWAVSELLTENCDWKLRLKTMDEIVNKVAQSSLMVFDLEDYYPDNHVVDLDICSG